jgi:pimeloyl-ACP methyl ester carboxylesterase
LRGRRRPDGRTIGARQSSSHLLPDVASDVLYLRRHREQFGKAACQVRTLEPRPGSQYDLLFRTDAANSKLAVFVHGFGQPYNAWGRFPELLKTLADDDPVFKDWDFLFIGYESRRIVTYLDIAAVLRSRIEAAWKGLLPNKSPYERFTLVGYSLGTLGIRQLLCANLCHPFPKFLRSINTCCFLGSPLAGAKKALLAFAPISLGLIAFNGQLQMLRAWTQEAVSFAGGMWPKIRLLAGISDGFVADAAHSAFLKFDGDFEVSSVSGGHLGMTEIQAWKDELVEELRLQLSK